MKREKRCALPIFNPLVNPTVLPDGRIFVPTGPPKYIGSKEKDKKAGTYKIKKVKKITVPKNYNPLINPTVLPDGRVFVPAGPPKYIGSEEAINAAKEGNKMYQEAVKYWRNRKKKEKPLKNK